MSVAMCVRIFEAKMTPPSPLLVKVPDFGHFISLDRMNSVFSFNNYKITIFSILAASFCPKKNNGFVRVRGLAPSIPGSYAYVYKAQGK